MKLISGIDYKLITHPRYKYRLLRNIIVQTSVYGYTINHKFFTLNRTGRLTLKSGYYSDGPSGLTIDTGTFMRGSFIHDVLYQMLRMELIPRFIEDFDWYRKKCDIMLYTICREDGMNWFRATYVYYAVRLWGESSALPDFD